MSFDPAELLLKSPLSIVICDDNQRIVWCNDRFLDETHLAKDRVLNQLYAALPLEAVDKHAELVQLFNGPNGEAAKFHYWHEKLDKPQGGTVHFFARQRKHKNRLSQAASKLAGAKLSKSTNWVEFLEYEVSRSRRYDNPLAVLKIHLLVLSKPEEVDEKTLQLTIKDTLAAELRWADMIGHTDYGSYLAILPETPAGALEALQEKLSAALARQLDFVCDSMRYEIVFGAASWQKHDDSQQLLKRARAQLVEKLEALIQ
jgi:translation elongation factor EF-1beta